MSGTTTQNIYQSSIPPFMEDDYKQLMVDMGGYTDDAGTFHPGAFTPGNYEAYEDASGNPYARIQGFDPQQQQAFDAVGNLKAGYQPSFDAAKAGANKLGAIGNQVSAGSYYKPTDYENQGFTQEQYNEWMNPYTENVLNRAQARATTRFGEQQVQRDQQAAMTGGFGGSRRFVTNGLAQRDLNEQLSDLEATQYANNFNQAQQALVGQRQLGEASKQFGTNTRLKGADITGAAANLNMNLGQNQQKADIANANALLTAGGMKQQLGQQQLDIDYQDFLNQRDWDKQMIAQHSNLLRGINTSNTGQIATSQPANPTMANQAAGAITAAYPWLRQIGQNS